MTSGSAAAVIVAGGLGQRMNSNVPKQFMALKGRPVLQWSLEAFDKVPAVCQLILVLPDEWMEEGLNVLSGFKPEKEFVAVSGGKRRQDSVFAGLKAVDDKCRWVAVHDGARPGVSVEVLVSAFDSAFANGSAVCAMPSNDTLVRVENGLYAEQLDRNEIFRMQTPQIFRRDTLLKAFDHAERNNLNVTDEAGLVKAAGFDVMLTEGSETNIKVTRPEDLKILSAIL